MTDVVLFTDGGCRGNPGPGAWAAVLLADSAQELGGCEARTTNNRMELRAIIEGLGRLRSRTRVVVVTDSTYARNGMATWLSQWKRRGWKTAAKQPVKNADLWRALDELIARHDARFRWVRGHGFDAGNDRCDAIVNELMDRQARDGGSPTWERRATPDLEIGAAARLAAGAAEAI